MKMLFSDLPFHVLQFHVLHFLHSDVLCRTAASLQMRLRTVCERYLIITLLSKSDFLFRFLLTTFNNFNSNLSYLRKVPNLYSLRHQ